MLTEKDQIAHRAQLRAISIFAKRPEAAQAIQIGSAKVEDGLSCVYEQDGHQVFVDMAEAVGGSNTGPSPGYYGRAAICSCLAVGIKMAATREEISLDTVEVSIEQDLDNRGLLAVPGTCAAPLKTKVVISITSQATRPVIDDLVERTLESDPWFLAFRDAQEISTATVLNRDAS